VGDYRATEVSCGDPVLRPNQVPGCCEPPEPGDAAGPDQVEHGAPVHAAGAAACRVGGLPDCNARGLPGSDPALWPAERDRRGAGDQADQA
jgi:hypothetical protein